MSNSWAIALAVAGMSLLGTLLAADEAAAQVATEPLRCRVGAYVIAIHDFDTAVDTFAADLWLWSVCPTGAMKPLDTLEFINANDISTRLEANIPRGESVWSNIKVRGTFRHEWDERNYPFDRHTLRIVLEDGMADASTFVYVPDQANSRVDPAIHVPGWRITGFSLSERLATSATTFGDPDLPDGSGSDFSRLTLTIDIGRAELNGFFKLTAVIYVAFVLSLISYLLHIESANDFGAQIGLLAGAIFAVAVNLVAASAALSDPGGLTLVDKIHIIVLLYILTATVFAVGSRLLAEQGWDRSTIHRLNVRACVVAAVSFIAINAILVALASRAG